MDETQTLALALVVSSHVMDGMQALHAAFYMQML